MHAIALKRIYRIGGGVLLALLVGLRGAPAPARELLREGFEAPAGPRDRPAGRDDAAGFTRAEKDFRVEGAVVERRALRPGAASRGSISFDLQRRGDAPADARGTVFTLSGDARKGDGAPADEVFFVQVRWESEFDPSRPALSFRGHIFHEYGLGLWPPEVLLPEAVAPGEWVHVDLVWDDGTQRYDLYVDGRRQSTEPLFYEPETLRRRPDTRPLLNEESRRAGAEPYFKSWRFSRMLGLVDEVHLGAHTMRTEEGVLYTPLSNAVVDNFVITIDEIPAPGYVPPAPASPTVAAVEHDAAKVAGISGKLVAGDRLGVTVRGSAGAAGTFDLVHFPGFDRAVELDWRGWGVYLEDKAFLEAGEVNLREVEEYRVYAGAQPLGAITPQTEPLARLEVGEQRYTLENLAIDAPTYAAVYALLRDGTLRAVIPSREGMPLVEGEPGVYGGSCTVGYLDRMPRATVVGRLALGEASASLLADPGTAFAADPALTVAVATEPRELRADEKSTAKVEVSVTDANGNGVAGHRIRFLLATTSQYTGVVGGGAFAEQVGGGLEERASGETDLFGRLTATYVAGFAAKTAVIVARDMESNDTGAGYVKTYITASADIGLEPVEQALAAEGYELVVTSSDRWLTADGRSTARITARLTLHGEPVEGHRIGFGVPGGMGSIRVVEDTTDAGGEARAVYTAGTKIGVVAVTATDAALDLSASVAIELRSDAPAKIAIRVDPETLPADGRSRADILVLVTDINDNPSDATEVEYRIAAGEGSLREDLTVTDRRGETENVFTAGRTPGRATVELTVRSPAPSEEELLQARGLAVAVTDYKFF